MKNKINVNISPNPLDLQTLHCSQNDTSERKFYFTLHNNGEVIDTTDISDPIFEPFDVYKGGTEQILPVNTDDPTTSPIIADIQYPDEEKTEQEFTYRESPTTIDGKALVEKIKGNTIVWNQIVQNGNFTSASNWTASSGTSGSVASNVYTLTATADNQYTNLYQTSFNGTASVGDKFLFSCYITSSRALTKFRFAISSGLSYQYTSNTTVSANTRTRVVQIMTITTANTYNILRVYPNHEGTIVAGDTFKIENVFCINLTKAFGSGNEPTIDEFTSLFPLPYYQYDAGSLLSFNGTGIKTVGRNLLVPYPTGTTKTQNGITGTANADGTITFTGTATGTFWGLGDSPTFILPKGTYILSVTDGTGIHSTNLVDHVANAPIISVSESSSATFTLDKETSIHMFNRINTGTTINTTIKIMLEVGTRASSYEPYTTSTTTIPTDTYFPTGMKSAGSVYDELTNSKAITRIGEEDLGTLEWTYNATYKRFTSSGVSSLVKAPSNNYTVTDWLKTTLYTPTFANNTAEEGLNMLISVSPTANILIRNTSYTSENDFKTAMDGVMLQYELAEEQVVNFTHASLVCEDGESALYHDDDSLACECTEDFSKDSGFKDCKIKITNDDGVVYSNKIQLHIERKP